MTSDTSGTPNANIRQCATCNPDLQVLFAAFDNICDKNALAWSVLDTKSESAVVRAVALSAIRRAGSRAAWVEHAPKRLDLVLLSGQVKIACEAKAAYLTDFQKKRVDRGDWYLGGCTDGDLAKLAGLTGPARPFSRGYALFFLFEVEDPKRQSKYGSSPRVQLAYAQEALRKAVALGDLVGWSSIDCGLADLTNVKIHMAVFTPKSAPCAPCTCPDRQGQ